MSNAPGFRGPDARGEGAKQLGSFYQKDGRLYFIPKKPFKGTPREKVKSVLYKIFGITALIVGGLLALCLLPLSIIGLLCYMSYLRNKKIERRYHEKKTWQDLAREEAKRREFGEW